MKKSELLARIAALEARVLALEAQRVTVPLAPTWPAVPMYPGLAPNPWPSPYVVTCGNVTAQPLFGASH